MNQKEWKRLVDKSDRQLFINDLIIGFGLSKVEAEALYDRITLLYLYSGITFPAILIS